MLLIISNNEIIIRACLFKRRLNYSLSDDQLEGRKCIRQMVIVGLFSGEISEYVYFFSCSVGTPCRKFKMTSWNCGL